MSDFYGVIMGTSENKTQIDEILQRFHDMYERKTCQKDSCWIEDRLIIIPTDKLYKPTDKLL